MSGRPIAIACLLFFGMIPCQAAFAPRAGDTKYDPEEIVLWKIASTKYYLNRSLVLPDTAESHSALLLRYNKNLHSDRALFANQIILSAQLLDRISKLIDSQNNFVSKFPRELATASVGGILDTVTSRELPALDQARRQAIARLTERFDGVRRQKIEMNLTRIDINLSLLAMGDLLEKTYPNPEYIAPGATLPLRIDPESSDVIGIRNKDTNFEKIPMIGPFVKMTYLGEAPIRHVVLISHSVMTQQAGVPDGAQATTLTLNEMLDPGAERNKDVATLLNTNNLPEACPNGGFAYAEQLVKGDIIRMPLGSFDSKFLQECRVSIFTDRGSVRDHILLRREGKRQLMRLIPIKSPTISSPSRSVATDKPPTPGDPKMTASDAKISEVHALIGSINFRQHPTKKAHKVAAMDALLKAKEDLKLGRSPQQNLDTADRELDALTKMDIQSPVNASGLKSARDMISEIRRTAK